MLEAEQAVIGCILIDCGLRAHANGLRGQDFESAPLGLVFDRLMAVDGPVDIIIATDVMNQAGARPPSGTGWGELLASTTDGVPSVEHIREYVAIVRRSSIARRLEARRHGG